jgi:hypothetical protein
MTYNWYDTNASTWYQGYGPAGGSSHTNAGSFVDLSTLTQGTADYNKALDAVTNNIIGLFEQKGITADQAKNSQQYQDLISQAQSGDTKGAFQGAAAAVTSAADRGDLWGADASEGGDAMRGRSFLESGVSDTTTIADLYQSGFGREGDAEGTAYWQEQLDGGMSIQDIAASFAQSDEASVRDVYHNQYGRDADQSGLDYWLDNDESVTGISDADNLRNVITYRGEDQDDDDKVSAEERLTSKYNVSAETMVRDDLRDYMGQVSNKDEANNPFFTDANNADVQRYVDHIRGARTDDMVNESGERIAGVGNQDAAYDDSLFTNTHIDYRMITQDALNQGDRDDYFGEDLDGDGQITGDEITASPTGMGRFGTKAEQKEYMDAHSGVDSDDLRAAQDSNTFGRDLATRKGYGQGVFSSVMDKTWGALTHEKVKTLDDYDFPDGPYLTKEGAEKRLLPENLDHWKKNSSLWFAQQGKGKGKGPIGEDGWRINPTTPDLPTPLPVDRKDINYMPNVSSDVQDTSGYAQAKRDFDSSIQNAYTQQAAKGQVGQRLTDTSAKGVKMKRSKSSRMGTIRGTKQLGREQQTKSLNI